MNNKTNFKRVIAILLFFSILVTVRPKIQADATAEKYPYTLFAASDEEGAVTVNSGNFCVNGSIATNGSVVVNGNKNINGSIFEQAYEDMIYKFDSLDKEHFSSDTVQFFSEEYNISKMNLNMNIPLVAYESMILQGNVSLNTSIKSYRNMQISGQNININNSVIISKYGDILISGQNVSMTGLIYAPFGKVTISAQNVNLNNVIIIADNIVLNGEIVNINYNSDMAGKIGYTSEMLNVSRCEWKYMNDENENEFPDFFEDMKNWYVLQDSDFDILPDVIEVWLDSDVESPDSDGDSIDDYYEVFITLTDLKSKDTDGNGVLDGDEDLDGDGVTNLQEYEYNTHPLYSDSDSDELSDFEEIFIYFTSPNSKDTDSDSANDKWEIENGFNALKYNNSFDVVVEVEGESISANVTMQVPGVQVDSLVVDVVDDMILLDDTIPGYIGSPFSFEIDGDFEEAKISFIFDNNLLEDEKFDPVIYYFNEDTQLLEEMPTTVEGNVASTVTTHFSTYILLDKTSYWKAWQSIKAPGTSSNTEEINIAFAVDTSGSMDGNNLSTSKGVIVNFIQEIKNNSKKTNVALIKFSNVASLIQELTDDYNMLIFKLNNLVSSGGTAIYTGLNKALGVLSSKVNEDSVYNAIILLTDGYDDPVTSYSKYQQYIEKAKADNINVYTVGVGSVDEQLLLSIADETGGRYFYADDAANLYEIYSDIQMEIIDYITDSNNDGISDYYTNLLLEGKLRIGTQCDIFSHIVIRDLFVSGDDYDNDGIRNGEEIEIVQNEEDGRVYVYMHSNPFKADSDYDGLCDIIDNCPLDANKGFLIYETIKTDEMLKSYTLEERPEDYKYADKTVEELRDMRYITWLDLAEDVDFYEKNWKSLVKCASMGNMQDVAIDMVNHFMDGTGTAYYNDLLTEEIATHYNTRVYFEGITGIIHEYIQENEGDISGLAYNCETTEQRKSSEIVKQMDEKKIKEPYYKEWLGGLGICVDSLYGNQIEIVSYKYDGNTYEYTLRFTMYDVFGLDSADVEEPKIIHPILGFGFVPGFKEWYILQHNNIYGGEYQPYITYMVFEKTVTGEV